MANNKQVNQFDISGKILFVGPPEQFTNKKSITKTYRILVLEVYVGSYSNQIAFEFNEQNMVHLNQLKEGQWCTVTFQLRGWKVIREAKAYWYNKIEGLAVING